jgi:hypothetical protein
MVGQRKRRICWHPELDEDVTGEGRSGAKRKNWVTRKITVSDVRLTARGDCRDRRRDGEEQCRSSTR